MKALRRIGSYVAVLAVGIVLGWLWIAEASAATSSVTTSSGYTVSITGPASGRVGVPATYTATCGPAGAVAACPWGEFRAFGGPLNRLGEGFGRGAIGVYTPRAPGFYAMRYRVGAACVGSPRLACPIDVWLNTSVTL